MITTPHKLMKAVTEFVAALTPAEKAEIRRALIRNARKTAPKRKP
jgi:hypothetical protein